MNDGILPLLKPDLYAVNGTRAPTLLGGHCDCGYVFFPFQNFGCERCGRSGVALQPLALKGCGRLRAVATVHVHADEQRKVPFVVGTIALDEGPVIRTLQVDPTTEQLAVGMRVEAVLIPIQTKDGRDALDLRFRTVGSHE